MFVSSVPRPSRTTADDGSPGCVPRADVVRYSSVQRDCHSRCGKAAVLVGTAGNLAHVAETPVLLAAFGDLSHARRACEIQGMRFSEV